MQLHLMWFPVNVRAAAAHPAELTPGKMGVSRRLTQIMTNRALLQLEYCQLIFSMLLGQGLGSEFWMCCVNEVLQHDLYGSKTAQDAVLPGLAGSLL